MNRALSTREKQGWRRYWDGWVICPRHIALRRPNGKTWTVPAHYDRPIGDDEKCSDCTFNPLPPLPFVLPIRIG